jgi:predicted O-methyltransferase YrrM
MERFYADKYIALEREQAAFCHLVARSIGARRIVELGTSFGVSTIWLAAAVRANGGGVVITTEVVREKALRAHRNIDDAGLGRFVEIRVGDARETLRDLAGPIDLLLIDGYPPAALDVLRIVAPHLRTGAVVLADNVGSFKADLADYLAWMTEPGNGFATVVVPYKSGTAYSIKCADTGSRRSPDR